MGKVICEHDQFFRRFLCLSWELCDLIVVKMCTHCNDGSTRIILGVTNVEFGVDADTCTGDRACIRISGCPSLSIKPNPDPLRTDPVTTVLDSCVGCGMCGEVSHAAVLCPSFYKAQIVSHPSAWERWWDGLRSSMVAGLQRRRAQKLAQWAF